MSTTTHTSNGHRPPLLLAPHDEPASAVRNEGLLERATRPLELPAVFTATVLRYLLLILPNVHRELAHWQAAAHSIPDARLRASALRAFSKRGNIEGAALFATLAPPARRRQTVRALVAYQSAYNYLDALSELPSCDPLANADSLHQALLTALHPTAEHCDYYEHNPARADGGYLCAMLDACRQALGCLPSFPALAPTMRAAAARIVDFQTLNLSDADGGHDALERWATPTTPTDDASCWWETAAAAGSSLSVHALTATAAQPGRDEHDAREIDGAYHPAASALHSLLDSLVDREEDHRASRRCLLDNYTSGVICSIRLGSLAAGAREDMRRLPDAPSHRVILTAMCSYYLSAPECDTLEAHRVSAAVAEALGLPLDVAVLMFRSKRLLHTLTDAAYA